MPNLLAMSFEGQLTPSFELKFLKQSQRPDGWGLAYYPRGEPSASVLKEAAPEENLSGTERIKAWDHLESSTFLLHIRHAMWGSATDANTQPFARAWGGREWTFAHSGSLKVRPELRPNSWFEPVGATDSEIVFCELMSRMAEHRWRTLADVDPQILRAWLQSINELGALNIALSDGRDLCVYTDAQRSGLQVGELLPPYEQVSFGDDDLEVDLTRRGAKSRKGVVVCSLALNSSTSHPIAWRPLGAGQLLMIRQGAVRAEVGGAKAMASASSGASTRPARAPMKRMQIHHRTVYRYQNPVERSSHVLRLTPMHDRLQTLLSHQLAISVNGEQREFEDVFGNRVRRLRVDTPFTEMVLEATSQVQLLDTDPLSDRPMRSRSTIPLVWMPWHRQMLSPYLLPPELAESELSELTEYAMSFVERHDYDLLDTLLDINRTIFKEYQYVPGATSLSTTAFDVYAKRQGVCQDFANLFICLARLLGVPARYVCGYVYTGPKNPNQRQSEASHAWVQVYLPDVGWKGFDPTNGILTQTDHIRVAVGRIYNDATPTAGTIYVGGGPETLEVTVRVEPMDSDSPAA